MKRLFVFLCLLLALPAAQARLTIEITQGSEGALPIAIVPFTLQGVEGAAVPAQDAPATVIAADLARSGRFAPLPLDAIAAQPATPDFAYWRQAGVENLVLGRLRPGSAAGELALEFQLFAVSSGEQLAGYRLSVPRGLLRHTAHRVSDLVYEKLIGEPGAFTTHIAYITVAAASGQEANPRRYHLAVADADGFNEQVILSSSRPLMSPVWSPDGRRLAYVSFEEGRSMVYLQEVVSGKREVVAQYPGLNSAPAFSPDGRHLALTLSKDGNSEIYLLRLADKSLTRITHSFAIDTEAEWAPDGRSLLFTSDRGGRPQIYRVALNATLKPQGRPQRLTFEGDYNARARFSPDGKRLALVHGAGGRFRIGLYDIERASLRLLTDTRLDESPSFAPNGAMVIYATEVNHRGVLAAASVEGNGRQRLGGSDVDVREPAWSPYPPQSNR